LEPTSEELEQKLSQARSGSDGIFESSNVVQEVNQRPVCVIDETWHYILRKLLRVTLFCLKFIKRKVWDKCSDALKQRIIIQKAQFLISTVFGQFSQLNSYSQ